MALENETGFDECFPPAIPITLRIGELTVTLSPPHHDDATWTSLGPLFVSDAPQDPGPMLRFDIRPSGTTPARPDSQAGEDGTLPGPQAGGPTPPPRDTPS